MLILCCSSNTSVDMRVVIEEDASQPKVGYLRIEVFVQKNVAGYDITVHNPGVTSLKQVCHTTCRSF